jgi:hypothetical protein
MYFNCRFVVDQKLEIWDHERRYSSEQRGLPGMLGGELGDSANRVNLSRNDKEQKHPVQYQFCVLVFLDPDFEFG